MTELFVNKQFVGIWHIRSIFKFALNMHNVYKIPTFRYLKADRTTGSQKATTSKSRVQCANHSTTLNYEKIFYSI